MENANLEELKTLIEEEIYLIPKDREAILAKLEIQAAIDLSTGPKETAAIPVKDNGPSPSVPASISPPTPDFQTPADALIRDPISIHGNFSKGVLILHEEEVLAAEVMEMLVKMIKACGHSMTEVGMVASAALENRTMEEFQNLNAHIILKFGRIKHPINAIPAPRYQVYAENETEYLFADSLSEISEDKNLKVKLWTSLQVLFNLTTKK